MEFMSKRANYFIVVAQEGSISKAADRLCITPSPLSRRIKEMEDSLNVKLFNRDNNRMALTKEGRFLYDNIIPHYKDLNRIKGMHKEKKQVNVGIYGITSPHVNVLIEHMMMMKPSLMINLTRIPSTSNLECIDVNNFNILFTTEPLPINNFTYYFCSEDDLLLMYSSKKTIEQSKLLPFVQSNSFSETLTFKKNHVLLQKQGFSMGHMNVDSLQLRLSLTRKGGAVTLICDSIKSQLEISSRDYNCRLLSDMKITHHIYVDETQISDGKQILSYLNDSCTTHWKWLS
ncbi:LysR family transcriptional regulator [Serratia sp. OS31]|uniref:LysR family transcriptional regulator n=1 Tax=Serratia sp. OS31 TaxID=2760844 RepID=UPI0015FF10FF|nr:LysR family transcriptional regulator [Serratia sp. OS31]MBB1585096.1 LysR family transcriptional regulator [Serratia sp. OS31]